MTVWSAKNRPNYKSGEGYVRNLTDEQSRLLMTKPSNDLNGSDPKGTMYTGGTPLFDETTGGNNRSFKYLFGKFPHLKRYNLETMSQ